MKKIIFCCALIMLAITGIFLTLKEILSRKEPYYKNAKFVFSEAIYMHELPEYFFTHSPAACETEIWRTMQNEHNKRT
ncbi:MAG: hypothetical protein IJD14_06380 [Christensenellaceae bacterium]|nr:hypothetical protein [Christensenellaceae bacterium]